MKRKDLNKRIKELESELAKKEKSIKKLLVKKGYKLLVWVIVLLITLFM